MGGIAGATVKIKGTTLGTITDFDGYYEIDAKIGDEIEVSYLGYKTIVLKATKSILNIELKSHTEFLDEIVSNILLKLSLTSSTRQGIWMSSIFGPSCALS